MRDWDQFLEETSWFLQPGVAATVSKERPWSRGGVTGLPNLSALLALTTVTPVSIAGTEYELLAWGPQHARQGWLCYPPLEADPGQVHPIHKDFWLVCGGIVALFREPETWWMNQNDILTAAASRISISDTLALYSWKWEEEGLTIPIQPDEYYVIAEEANANLTIVHRESGRLLLFALDHAFDRVTTLPGCPPCSLLTFDDEDYLGKWIEQSVFECLKAACWNSPEILNQKRDGQKQDKAVTQDTIRQVWLRRLRPRQA